MITVYVHERGETRSADRVDPAWLDASSPATVWVDLSAPGDDELGLLSDLFHFHPLSIEDARSELQYPKVEAYPGYLYVVLHGIDRAKAARQFATRDIDFFIGRNYLVTVHDSRSRSVALLRELCGTHARLLSEGPVGLFHRIVDTMVGNYRPVVDEEEERIEDLEQHAMAGRGQMTRQVLRLRRDLAVMRRILVPQRDVIGRLARREFTAVSDEMAFRFRDVYDQLTRLTEEASMFQDRVTGLLEVHLAVVSNRLNLVVKVLTVMSTIFLPLTVLTGMWGMNVLLPRFPGGDAAQFWWVGSVMIAVALAMLVVFRQKKWI